VYLTPWCPYCTMARRLLTARGIGFEVFDVSGNAAARAWLRTSTKQHTVPQIFIKGRSVGGYDQLSELDERGELTAWLAGSPP
jgi:glutaredoxin 3